MQFILTALLALQTSLYSLSFNVNSGTTVSFNQYQGHKILLVNIATGSSRVSQLAELQQLHELYDSLIIIAFPSNSFGHESRTDQEIQTFCQTTYHTSFTIAQKGTVKNTGIVPVYNWLSQVGENGVLNGPVSSDFQKFLIDEQGNIVGTFSAGVSPVSSLIKDAINTNYQ